MLIKSYEVSKKNLNFINFFLIYGENIGLKQDVVKSVLELKENKNEKYKQFEFEEEEIMKNQKVAWHYTVMLKKMSEFILVFIMLWPVMILKNMILAIKRRNR